MHVISTLRPSDEAEILARVVDTGDKLDDAAQRPVARSPKVIIVCLTDLASEHASIKSDSSVEIISMGRKGQGPGPLAFWRLARLIRERKPDIVQTWDYAATLIGTIAQRLSGPTGPALIWTLSDPPPPPGAMARFLPGLLALFSDWPKAIIARSEEIRRAHAPLGFHSRDWRIIPWGAESADPTATTQTRVELRAAAGLASDDGLVVQILGADWTGDLARFLSAAKALARTEPKLKFAVLAPSNNAASPKFEFSRRASQMPPLIHLPLVSEAPARALAAADILVAPGRAFDTLPRLMVDALALGVPCITDSGGDAENILNEPVLIVPPDDVAALSGAIRRLHRMPVDRLAMLGAKLKTLALEKFAPSQMVARYQTLIEETLNQRADTQRILAEMPPGRSLAERMVGRLAESIGLRGRVSTRTLAGTVILVALMTAIGRSATFIREVMVAATFGTGPELEAYFLALAFPTFLTVSTTAAIPAVYARISSEAAPEDAPYVLGRMTLLFGVVALAVMILLSLTAPFYMKALGNGLPAQTTAIAIGLVPWVCAIIISQVWIALWTMALNLRGRFALPALLSALTPFGVVVALIVVRGDATAETLAYGTAAGAFVETLVIAALCLNIGIRFRLPTSGLWLGLRGIGRETATVVVGTISLGFIPLADQMVSAQVGPGSVGAFMLGSKIVASITGISAIALSQAVIPRISQLATTGDRLALLALSRNAIVLVSLAGLIASAVVSVFSEPIVEFVFARGKFGPSETAAVAAAQGAYAWHIAPFLAWIVISRILVTLGASRFVLVLSAVAALLNLGLDLAVVRAFGVPGIALTTAASFGFAMVVGLLSLRRTILPPA